MNRSRITGDLVSQNNIFVDIVNDRVGIGSTIPAHKLSLPDSGRISFGNSADLTMHHDGNHGVIQNTTGNLHLIDDSIKFQNDNLTVRLHVTTSGITVDGNIAVTGTVDGVDIAALNTTVGNITTDLVTDTSPQLGGDLDVQASKITTSTSNGNVKIEPNGTGVVEVRGAGGYDGTLQLNCSAQSHGIKLKSPPHSAAATYTLTFPTSVENGKFLTTNASGQLSWATVSSTDTTYTAGTGLTLSGTVFSLANHSAALLTSGTIAAARIGTVDGGTF